MYNILCAFFQLLAFSLACAVAAPAPEPYVSTSSFDSTSRGIQFSSANAKILGQINQHNEDGSYTFGYESEDGSFRIENRDIDGYVSGKYGYVDANGQVQEFGKFQICISYSIRNSCRV
jgi:hypothetical protein